MSIKWPQRLVTELARRRAVILVGAGVSANSINDKGERPPGWEDFIRQASASLDVKKKNEIEALLKKEDLLAAGERLKSYRGSELMEDIRNCFSRKKFQHAEIHKQILALDPRIVLTTNFDKIYDSYANSPGTNTLSGSLVVKNFCDPEIVNSFRDTDRVLIRLHGSTDKFEDLILTRTDYARARVQMRHSYEALDALMLTHTFFFLGFSLRDPDIQLILEAHAVKYPHSSAHYATMYGEPSDLDTEFNRKVMKIELLPYESKVNLAGNQDHSDLTTSLGELVNLVEVERENLRTTLEW